MPEDIVIRCCAPTLAAIKTGSLFNYAYQDREELMTGLRGINKSLLRKGICAIPLRIGNGRALIYLYRPSMLERDLRDALAEKILSGCGYPAGSVAERIAFLIGRLRETGDFPHEIGLFLGYPPADVQGFMDRKTCKCTGIWKVFESSVEDAKQYFERCRKCTGAYLQRNREGWSLSRLTVQP